MFSNTLAVGAFSPSLYTVTSTDSVGVSPAVSAALVVPDTANSVELALASDLVPGAHYQVTGTVVPSTDTTTFTGSDVFMFGNNRVQSNAEPARDDLDELVFGRDLYYNGGDYVETVDGDLATISGLGNAHEAVRRRVFADGLPWDDSYGAHAGQYVDGAPGEMFTLKGAILAQLAKDDRVQSSTVDFVAAQDGTAVFSISPKFINGEQTKSLEVKLA